MSYLEHLYVVILCGGTGTRVWPLSMKKKPKQFLNFYEDKTLFQSALKRALTIVPPEKIIAITNEKYINEIKKEAPEIAVENILAEPEKKNTAMAMGTASAFIAQKDPQAVVINLYSDHVVKNVDLFAKTMKAAAQVAFEQKHIITVGIKPTYAHPGLGYIEFNGEIIKQNNFPVFKVHSFKEKPDTKTAQKYLEAGNYLWNTGFYIWKIDMFINEFKTLSPDIAKCTEIAAQGFYSHNLEKVKKAYRDVEDISIDFAIAEKTDKLLVIPGTFDWNDVGSWEVVYELGQKDKNQNVFVQNADAVQKPPIETYNSKGSLVYYTDKPIAIVGLQNIVVVDTGSGILVCDRTKSNDVKKIVDQLKDKKLEDYI